MAVLVTMIAVFRERARSVAPAFLLLGALGAGGALSDAAPKVAPAETSVTDGRVPQLTVNFSHFTNRGDHVFIILNVTNVGTGVAAISKGLSGGGVYSFNAWSITSVPNSPTNAGWAVLPPGTNTQVDFDSGGTNLWPQFGDLTISDDRRFFISVPYTDTLATNTAPDRYRTSCEDIPHYKGKSMTIGDGHVTGSR